MIFYFFIGTDAEFIKLNPVLEEFRRRKIDFKVILSGQNNLESKLVGDVILSKKAIENPGDLLFWFAKTFIFSYGKLKRAFEDTRNEEVIFIVHGDTLSTVMGAIIARFFGFRIAHIEAGLRSFDYLSPFPEEIDRVLTSKFTSMHFCPNSWAVENLKNISGEKVNTYQNTLIESFHEALNSKAKSPFASRLNSKKYFIFLFHRQENLLRRNKAIGTIKEVLKYTDKINCVFVTHAPTKGLLKDYSYIDKLGKKKNLILSDRHQ